MGFNSRAAFKALLGSGDGTAKRWDVSTSPVSYRANANQYHAHPTLLDSCFQVIIATLPQTLFEQGDALYLPTGIRSFQLHTRPGPRVWSHARLTTAITPTASMLEGDVRILDEHGNLIAEAQGLQLQRSEVGPATQQKTASTTTPVQSELDQWLYQLNWEPTKLPTSAVPTTPGHWLIFADKQGIGQRLTQQLQEQGQSCSLIETGETFKVIGEQHYQVNPAQTEQIKQVTEEALRINTLPLQGIIHLWSLNSTPVAATSLTTLATDQKLGVHSALSVIQSLLTQANITQARLWLVTQGAQPVVTTDTSLEIAQSPLWGLGKTCAMEHPELWGGLIDLDIDASLSETIRQLLTVLQSETSRRPVRL